MKGFRIDHDQRFTATRNLPYLFDQLQLGG
jgi:hypothetical protein